MSSSGTSESPIIAPDLQRSHTLVLKSSHSRNYSETSCFGTSESPIIAPDLQSIPTHAVISLHGRDTPSLLLLTTTHIYMGYTDLNKTRGRVPKNALFDNER